MPSVTEKPDLSPDQIRRWLRENYSMDGDLALLPGERDLNFKLCTEDGETFVCKIVGDLDDLDLLTAQNEVLAFLNQRDLASIPKVLTSQQGQTLVPLYVGRQKLLGRVLTFVPGQVLAKCAPYSPSLLRDLGRNLGQLDRALQDYDHPAFHYSFDWDLANSIGVVERYGELIPDAQVREGIELLYRNFREIVPPRFPRLRKGVIHNDANDYNVLVDGDRVTGLIDFGDMVYSYTVCDLAIAMAYAALGADEVFPAMEQIAIGYHESMAIREEELAVLFPMMCMRLAVSACMAAHQMRLRSDDPYLSISQEPIRKALPRILELDFENVHQMLKRSLS